MAQSALDEWAEDHNRRRLAEMYGPSILSAKETIRNKLAQYQIISKSTLLARYNISLEEERRRVMDAERIGQMGEGAQAQDQARADQGAQASTADQGGHGNRQDELSVH